MAVRKVKITKNTFKFYGTRKKTSTKTKPRKRK